MFQREREELSQKICVQTKKNRIKIFRYNTLEWNF